MELKLSSIETKNLSKKNITEICKLKNTFWKFSIKNQLLWFKKNIRYNDIHNCLYSNKKLIGYTVLRKGYYTSNKTQFKKKKNYLLFETLIIEHKYRKSLLGKLLMAYNNSIIDKKKLSAFLICKKKLENFYLKHGWEKINKLNFQTDYKSFNCSGMLYKLKVPKNIKIRFNVY